MYLTPRFFALWIALVLLIGLGYAVPLMFVVGRWMLGAFCLLLLLDMALLYHRTGIQAWRMMSERFSNGDDNEVDIRVESQYPFSVRLQIIDEIPPIFQRRDVLFKLRLLRREGKKVRYALRPTVRGT